MSEPRFTRPGTPGPASARSLMAFFFFCFYFRDFPTFSKQGPGTNDFGKNNMYVSQIGKIDTKQNRGYYAYLVLI